MSALRAAGRLARLAGIAADVLAGRRRLHGASAAALEVLGVNVLVDGPLPPQGALLAANHLSWLDPLVVASLVPCTPIAKAELSGWPLLGRAARACGVLFVERGDATSGLAVKRGAQAVLERGGRILNFPEGTTTRGDDVLAFRPGLFGTARRAGAPVVPVAITLEPAELAWTGDDAFLPHLLALAARRRSEARVRFGAPVPPLLYRDAAALAEAVRGRVLELRGGAPWRRTQP
ncbi:MAG: lysophospholipid acyltransferase family protein [Anaeromyxobacteraceae bacterium]